MGNDGHKDNERDMPAKLLKSKELTDRSIPDSPLTSAEISDLCRSHITPLYRFLLCRLDYEKNLAEEICQETFRQALQSPKNFRGASAFFTWLCSIAIKQLSRHRRTAEIEKRHKEKVLRHRTSLLQTAGDIGQQTLNDNSLQNEAVKTCVHRAITMLNPRDQEILNLRYIKGLEVGSISSKTEKSYKAVESALSRARAAFKDAFAKIVNKEDSHER